MTRQEVRSLLGDGVSVFKRWPYTRETDAYNALGLHLEYDNDNRLRCVEAFGLCAIYYGDLSLLKRPIESVAGELEKLGLASRYDDGHFFDGAGFFLYAPNGIVEGVTVY